MLLIIILPGCAPTKLFIGKLDAAEEELAQGRHVGETLSLKPALLPPSYDARHKIALVMESVLKDEVPSPQIVEDLKGIRNDPYLPSYLKVEAGYILVLLEKMGQLKSERASLSEKLQTCSADTEKIKRAYEELKKLNEEMKKDVELLNFKLKKLEEIYLDTQKRRGTQ
ncbi:MAG: hypothetical protein ACP5G0_03765 [Desulfomonilia bacterium]